MTTVITTVNTSNLNQKKDEIQFYNNSNKKNENENESLNDRNTFNDKKVIGNESGKVIKQSTSESTEKKNDKITNPTPITTTTTTANNKNTQCANLSLGLSNNNNNNNSNNNNSSQWDSFAGFHWDAFPTLNNKIPPDFSSSSEFTFPQQQNNKNLTPPSTITTSSSFEKNNILSVPMLPNVTPEPFYRQQRSLSFPTIDLTGTNQSMYKKSSLTTMTEEEDDDHDDICNFNNNLHDFDDLNPSMKTNTNLSQNLLSSKLRFRSQSSGAATDLSPHYFHSFSSSLDPSSQFQTRNSLSSISSSSSSSTTTNTMSNNDHWDLLQQQQQQQSNINNNNNTNMDIESKRRQSSIASLWNHPLHQENDSFIHSTTSSSSLSSSTDTFHHQRHFSFHSPPSNDFENDFLNQRRFSQPLDGSFSENNPIRRSLSNDYQLQPSFGYANTTKENDNNQLLYYQQQHPYFNIPTNTTSTLTTGGISPLSPQPSLQANQYQSFQDIPSNHSYSIYSLGQNNNNNNNNNNMMMMNSLVLPLTPPLYPHLPPHYQQQQSSPSLTQNFQHPLDMNDAYTIYQQQQQQQHQQQMNFLNMSHPIYPFINNNNNNNNIIENNNNINNNNNNNLNSNGTMGNNLSSNTNFPITTTTTTSSSSLILDDEKRTLNDIGKGIPLNQLSSESTIYMIEFKSRRIDFYYSDQQQKVSSMYYPIQVGDLVIVEADRGKDLGKVAMIGLSSDQVLHILKKQQELKQEQMNHPSSSSSSSSSSPSSSPLLLKKEQDKMNNENENENENNKNQDHDHDEKKIENMMNENKNENKNEKDENEDENNNNNNPLTAQESIDIIPEQVYMKRVYRLATPEEINMLLIKSQDEQRALVICQQKVKQRKLQMEIVDAEYQWDRRKLTFYFEAEKRIDFRDLVREMFKIYKTRIWMCTVNNKKSALDF
ncbi:unnamed protein product [Cunninghamella blakesleeana]